MLTSDAPAGPARLLPRWVRWAITGLVAAMFLASAAMLVASVSLDGRHDWALPAAAFAETAGTGLLVALVVFFVDRGRSLPRAEALTTRFLLDELARALSRLDHERPPLTEWQEGRLRPAALRSRVALRVAHAKGTPSADDVLDVGGRTVALQVELNVRRLGVACLLPARRGESAQGVFGALTDTVAGARDAGYHIGTAHDRSRPDLCAALGWERCVAHSFHRNLADDFLHDPLQRQFVAQDLAIMVRSVLRERHRAPA